MTLEIPIELEARLERAARERGTDARSLLLEAARHIVRSSTTTENNETRRLAAIRSLQGCLAGSDFTVDDFLRERSEEAREEALRDEQRFEQQNMGPNS